MSIVVEDGTGISDANSYIGVADASAYHLSRGNVSWVGVADKETALIKATDYLTNVYKGRWAGYRILITQALDWPRSDVPVLDAPKALSGQAFYASNAVPLAVRNACAELALRASTVDLNPDASGGTKKKTKVGPIEVEYVESASSGIVDGSKFVSVSQSLSGFLSGGSSSVAGGFGFVRVVRA
jgi:hypothetical protein